MTERPALSKGELEVIEERGISDDDMVQLRKLLDRHDE